MIFSKLFKLCLIRPSPNELVLIHMQKEPENYIGSKRSSTSFVASGEPESLLQ